MKFDVEIRTSLFQCEAFYFTLQNYDFSVILFLSLEFDRNKKKKIR